MSCNVKELRMHVFSFRSLGKFFETQSAHLSFDARKTGSDWPLFITYLPFI